MKLAIVGYNIFGTGGTSRSNINMLHELYGEYEITYFNTKNFSKKDVEIFNEEQGFEHKGIVFEHFSKLLKSSEHDIYLLTRENLFVLSKIIKATFPTAKVVGEVHAPLMIVDPDIDFATDTIDVYRVATPKCKAELEKKINVTNIVVFPVSTYHIDYSPSIENEKSGSKNFLIYSRFDEIQKNISYSIKLFDYLVNYLGHDDYFLYLKGSGPSHFLYRNLITYYNLGRNVFINEEAPEDYTYLSTSRSETFGYSIMEAFAAGNRICLYEGDDGVLKEIYGNFETFHWLTMDIQSDAQVVIECAKTPRTNEAYQNDIQHALSYTQREHYSKNYIENVFESDFPIKHIKQKIDEKEIYAEVYKLDASLRQNFITSLYFSIKSIKQVNSLLNKPKVKRQLSKVYNLLFKYDEDVVVKQNYFFIESFHGKNFSGDPKYLALEIKRKQPNAQIYVSSANQLVDMEILSYGFHPLRVGSKKYVSKYKECQFVIVNGNTLDKAGKSLNQTIIQTWHGFPLKKMVSDLEDPEERNIQSEDFLPRMQKWDYLLSSSSRNTAYIGSAFMIDKNPDLIVLEYGAPRNAYLIENRANVVEIDRIHKKYFNRTYNKNKYILYCPTWRKNNRKTVSDLDLAYIISRLPDDYEIIVKLHPLEGRMRAKYDGINERVHCFYNELVDIQELFLISDVLITDYSSAMFDYAHLHKKIIVLQEDSEDYNKEIGWYFDSNELIGISGYDYSEDELLAEIIAPVSEDYYCDLIEEYLMTDDNKSAAELILEEITKSEFEKGEMK